MVKQIKSVGDTSAMHQAKKPSVFLVIAGLIILVGAILSVGLMVSAGSGHRADSALWVAGVVATEEEVIIN